MQTRILLPILLPLLLLTGSVFAQVAPGPHQAGVRNLSFTDSSLATPLVDVRVYYAATAAGADQPLAAGSFPVIAFGHGFNMSYTDYEVICKHLAGWGYIVISPDVENGFSVSHLEFARELAACIQWMQAQGADTSSVFYNHVALPCGVFGHSMGGGASCLVPSVFPDIDAVSGLAPAETSPSAISALPAYAGPYQVLSGSEDNVAPEATNQQLMYDSAAGPKHWISITGGAHCKFSDASTICDFVSAPGSISREEQILLSKRYVTAFFNYYLRSDSTASVFLCGDSVNADVAANKVMVTTTLSCGPLTVIPPDNLHPGFGVFPNPLSNDELQVRSPYLPLICLPDGRELNLRWSHTGDIWTTHLTGVPCGLLLLRVPGLKGVVRVVKQ